MSEAAVSTGNQGSPPEAIYVADRGYEQVMVTIWQDGTADVAFRDPGGTWEPPLSMEERPVE